jgi:hypothetical protein
LVIDDDGTFHLWKYYGDRDADNLAKRKISSSEHYELVLSSYKLALEKKLKKKDFRRLDDGEAVVSMALGKILKPSAPKTQKSTKPQPRQEEHRKLRL